LKAIVKYNAARTPLVGEGEFAVYANGERIAAVPFSNETSLPLNSIDFSEYLNDYYARNQSDKIYLKLAIENYVKPYESAHFKLDFMMEANYTEQVPSSGSEAGIEFSYVEHPPLDETT